MAFDGGRDRNGAISASEEDGEVGPAEHDEKVACGGSEDVGAGDGVGAGEFEGGLGAYDEVEGVAGEGEVDVGVAFGGGEGGGGEEEGGVAAVGEEAVMEEEADGGGGGGGAGDLFGGDCVLDDLVELGAGLFVEVKGES